MFRDRLYRKDWVVYAKPPFGGPDQVYRYLGRYTHRIALSNRRTLDFRDGRVAFSWRDYADGGARKVMRVDAIEFLRRFLLHVLPKGFVRIRHYGLHAPRNIGGKLARARELLTGRPTATETATAGATRPWWETFLERTGIDIMACARCESGRYIPVPEPQAPLSSRNCLRLTSEEGSRGGIAQSIRRLDATCGCEQYHEGHSSIIHRSPDATWVRTWVARGSARARAGHRARRRGTVGTHVAFYSIMTNPNIVAFHSTSISLVSERWMDSRSAPTYPTTARIFSITAIA